MHYGRSLVFFHQKNKAREQPLGVVSRILFGRLFWATHLLLLSLVFIQFTCFAASLSKDNAAGGLRRVFPISLPALIVPVDTPKAAVWDSQKTELSWPLCWRILDNGLELGVTQVPKSISKKSDAVLVLLRISPASYRFSLHMASESGLARSLAQWAHDFHLHAGINASMYLPDNITSTGYMRSGGHINNSQIGSRLGAFFVAEPKKENLPLADILDAADKKIDVRKQLADYSVVVQNYRLIAPDGRVLWNEPGEEHSIAAVGKDRLGRILFILCQEPLSATDFVTCLQHLSLDLQKIMYVEGGAQAGLVYMLPQPKPDGAELPPVDVKKNICAAVYKILYPRHDAFMPFPYCVLKGRHSILRLQGNVHAPLPNILGIVPRR